MRRSRRGQTLVEFALVYSAVILPMTMMLTFGAQVPDLPLGLTITDMEPTSSGLRITGAGTEIPLMGSEVA